MPFYNNNNVGGAMDADHIYYNLTISNYYSAARSAFTYSGLWNNSVPYNLEDIVFLGGIYYQLVVSVSPQPNPTNTAFWTLISSSTNPSFPTYSGTITYNIGDKVNYLTSSYVLTALSPSPTGPDGTTYWSVIDITTTDVTTPIPNDTTLTSVPIKFNQNRAQPYLTNPSEYFLSVQRLSIDNTTTPVLVVQPKVGGASINETIYSITLVKNGTTPLTIPITWFPQLITPTPPDPVQSTYVNLPYYYCYSYEWFIFCINTSIQAATTTGFDNVPSLSFNASTGLFTIQAAVSQYRTDILGRLLGTGTGNSLPTYVFMNTNLFNLFASFNSIYYGGNGSGTTGVPPNVPSGTNLDYQILFPINGLINSAATPYITNVVVNPVTTGPDVYNIQDYNSLSLWSPIKSIVVRGSLLNVVATNIGTPVVYVNGININAGKQNTDVLPILIEYSVPLEKGTEYKPNIFFEPTGEYILADLYSDIPIYGLQFEIFWKDSFGNLNPLLLSLGSSASMKLLFRKKSFNSDKL